MSASLGRMWRRADLGRVLSGGVAAVVVLPLALVLSRADGLPATRTVLSGGGAWLASPAQGAVTLIDGASEQVVGAVQAPGHRPGADLSVVQAGSSAYLVSSAAGTVARVDGGTYEVSAPVQFGQGGSGGALQVYAGKSATFVVDGQRRTASVVDPQSLRVRQRLALAAQPGPGQSVVDEAGRLWVVDANGLAWFDSAGKHVRPDVGGAGMRLVLVAGRPVLVDRSRVGELNNDGRVKSWSCLELPEGGQAELLGSATLGRVLAAIPATGTLVVAGDGGEDCGQTVDVGRPGDSFGPLVESGGFVFVPNRTSGRTAVVQLSSRQVVANLDVVKAGARLELVAKDGLVFYNDLDGDRAGVIRFDGGRWRLGQSLRKFAAGTSNTKILTPGGNNRPKQPKQNAPQKPGQPPQQPQQQPDNPGGTPPPDGSAGDPAGPNPPGGPDNPPPPADQPDGGPSPTSPPPPPPQEPGAPPTAALTVQVVGAGSVTAASPAPTNVATAGTQCVADATCVWEYPVGTTAVLQIPTAPSPDVLLGPLTGCTTQNVTADSVACSVLINGAANVTATFVPKPPVQVTLTLAVTGAGSVTASPAGGAPVTCPAACTLTVVAGTAVELAASPGGGSYLSDWGSAGCSPSASTCGVTMAEDRAVTVTFAPFLDLTVRTGGNGAGSVSGPGLACGGGTCTGSYRAGDVVVLSATTGARSSFDGWTGCPAPSGTTCSVTMAANTAVTATFSLLPDTTAPTLEVSGGGQTATLTTGASVNRSGAATVIDIFVTATDPESAVTHIELQNNFQDDCSANGETRHDPARFDSASSNSGSLTYVLDMATLACGSQHLSQGGFAITVRATSAGGTSAFTQAFVVHYTD